nr:MAG TPA: hypothetical protein [Caudoviricetes sp.]
MYCCLNHVRGYFRRANRKEGTCVYAIRIRWLSLRSNDCEQVFHSWLFQ